MHVREEMPARPAAFLLLHRDDVDHIEVTADDPTVELLVRYRTGREQELMANWRLVGRG